MTTRVLFACGIVTLLDIDIALQVTSSSSVFELLEPCQSGAQLVVDSGTFVVLMEVGATVTVTTKEVVYIRRVA